MDVCVHVRACDDLDRWQLFPSLSLVVADSSVGAGRLDGCREARQVSGGGAGAGKGHPRQRHAPGG